MKMLNSTENLCPIKNGVLWVFFAPLLLAIALAIPHQFNPFDPNPLPDRTLIHEPISVPLKNPHDLRVSERVGEAEVELIVHQDAGGGLRVGEEGAIELLTDEAQGVKFKITDGVDVAKDGMIYFTDASYKYPLAEFIRDILEGKPHGRFMSYNPSTKETKVLVRDLYFANGVAVSLTKLLLSSVKPRRCQSYYTEGKREGTTDIFIENLRGMPDNIRSDGKDHYWLALAKALSQSTQIIGITSSWDLALGYPFIQKAAAARGRRSNKEEEGGVLKIALDGNPKEHYYDPNYH
ncbi:Strictosidine synthase, conserved region [Dillenia turbinata]|uniref:Strictosidine synthase, conserved region n=1 Tax=Dillenia turbinata TaxID=194707 RepID=A0AAN8V443_9MAGN